MKKLFVCIFLSFLVTGCGSGQQKEMDALKTENEALQESNNKLKQENLDKSVELFGADLQKDVDKYKKEMEDYTLANANFSKLETDIFRSFKNSIPGFSFLQITDNDDGTKSMKLFFVESESSPKLNVLKFIESSATSLAIITQNYSNENITTVEASMSISEDAKDSIIPILIDDVIKLNAELTRNENGISEFKVSKVLPGENISEEYTNVTYEVLKSIGE